MENMQIGVPPILGITFGPMLILDNVKSSEIKES